MGQFHRNIVRLRHLYRTVQDIRPAGGIQIDILRVQIDFVRVQQILIAFFFCLTQCKEKVAQPRFMLQDPRCLLQRRQTSDVVQKPTARIDSLNTERQQTDTNNHITILTVLFNTTLKIEQII